MLGTKLTFDVKGRNQLYNSPLNLLLSINFLGQIIIYDNVKQMILLKKKGTMLFILRIWEIINKEM